MKVFKIWGVLQSVLPSGSKNVASIILRSKADENSSTFCHGRDNKLFSGDI